MARPGADPNPPRASRSIATELLIAASILFLVTTTVVTVVQMVVAAGSARTRAAADIQTLGEAIRPSLAEALWSFDDDLINATVTGLLTNPLIRRVTVLGEHDEEIMTGAAGRAGPRPRLLRVAVADAAFPLSVITPEGRDQWIGTLILSPNPGAAAERLEIGLTTALINSVVVSICLWGLFLVLAQLRVIRPLQRLAAQVSSVDPDNVRALAVVERPPAREIGVVIATVNDLLRRVAESRLALDRLARDLETKVAERTGELAESEAKLRRILTTAGEGFWLFDRELRTLDVNAAMSAILGEPPERLIASPLSAWMAPDDAARLGAALTAPRGAAPLVFEIPVRRGDGGAVPCLIKPTPLGATSVGRAAGKGGRADAGSFVMVTDIGELKRAERALIEAKHAAEAANRAKSAFLANISHEVRTPLNAILGLSHLMQATSLDATQTDHLHKINGSAKGLLAVFNNILDYSKIEAGRLSLEEAAFNLVGLAESVAGAVAPEAKAKGIAVTLDLDPAVPRWLVGDPVRLKQVLVNLMSNGVKFTERGEVALTIRLGSRAARTATLEFAVRDTGIGIPPDQRAHLFEAFTQGDGSATRRYGGTGLGLAISARLVELLGGTLAVSSTPGAGSRFSFAIPLAAGACAPAASVPAPAAGASAGADAPLPPKLSAAVPTGAAIALATALGEIRGQLETGDLSAVDNLTALRDRAIALVPADQLDAVIAIAASYDFEQAAERLDALVRNANHIA